MCARKVIRNLYGNSLSFVLQTNVIYTSIQRVSLRNDINKHAPFVLQTLERHISSKCETNVESDDMNALLKASKCAAVWIK